MSEYHQYLNFGKKDAKNDGMPQVLKKLIDGRLIHIVYRKKMHLNVKKTQ